jgi:glyoxylase-like metal-dependent hydrolase (beta-lactamase superfamily II)
VRRLLGALLALVAFAVAGLAVVLGLAHREMRGIDPPLPRLEDLRALAGAEGGPVRLRWIDTASQPMPRSLVLDPARDPRPREPYVMAHAAFVLEWPDGRVLLVDAGMDRAAALAFGRPLSWAGAGPIAPRRSLAEAAGDRLASAPPGGVGLVFTHLHPDHVAGVTALCAALAPGTQVVVFQRAAQARHGNHTTRAGRALLDAAPCLTRRELAEQPAAPVPGFPGVFVLHAAGHTPGSQVIGAGVHDGAGLRGVLFAGDVANALDGILHDVPKPWAYRTFLVPENEARQQRVRRLLRQAAGSAGFTLLVSHDLHALERSGFAAWP